MKALTPDKLHQVHRPMANHTICFKRQSFAGYRARYRELVDLAVTETVYRPGQFIPSHSHERAYISIVLRGSYTEEYKSSIYDILPGHVILHYAGKRTRIVSIKSAANY